MYGLRSADDVGKGDVPVPEFACDKNPLDLSASIIWYIRLVCMHARSLLPRRTGSPIIAWVPIKARLHVHTL